MKTFDQLESVTTLQNNALLVANNDDNTATNNITYANLKSQILNGMVENVSFTGNTLSVKFKNNNTPTTYTIYGAAMVGATSLANGTGGSVPTPPSSGYDTKFLGADGEWKTTPHYASSSVVAAANNSTTNAAAVNNNVHLNHVENGSVTSAHKIVGAGATEVTSDANGQITITSTNTWSTMGGATALSNGTAGIVPAPSSTGYDSNFLGADGTWKDPLASLGSAAALDATDYYDSEGEDVTTGKAIAAALATLPEPMVFKGSLGTGGTITTLPAAASTGLNKNTGFVYKVIENGTYDSQAAKAGDTFISTGSAWILIPSGDEPSGTVTSIATGAGLVGGGSGSPITTSGTIKANLKSETASALQSAAMGSTASRQYAVGIDADGYLSVNIPWEGATVTLDTIEGTLDFGEETAPVTPDPEEEEPEGE